LLKPFVELAEGVEPPTY